MAHARWRTQDGARKMAQKCDAQTRMRQAALTHLPPSPLPETITARIGYLRTYATPKPRASSLGHTFNGLAT
eukprot:6200286-Pleurochrysis_carterae.AAC.1